MGNIMSGQELISRQENAQVYGKLIENILSLVIVKDRIYILLKHLKYFLRNLKNIQ